MEFEMATKSYDSLTRTQMRAIDSVLDHALYGRYEVKELDIRDAFGDISVSLTVGMPNDEGTMAYYFCRDSYLFWVGKQGGVYQYVEKKDGHYRKVYRKWGIVERYKF